MERITNLDVERVPIDSIHPHPDNARRGDLDVIADSLQVHGQFVPLVVQRSTGHIVKGNHTWQAAKALGFDVVDVSFLDIDDDQALRILLIDNRASDLGGYEEQSLTELLASLNDLLGTGYDPGDLDARLATLSSAPAPESWDDRDTKTVLLAYPAAEHGVVCDRLDVLAERFGVADFAAVVARLVADDLGRVQS